MKLFDHFTDLSELQRSQFEQLLPLYTEWNTQINVVSRKDIDELEVRHILHSLAIARFIEFKPGQKIMDLGTGGGFPGIPLAILYPEVEFLLVDSIGKKIKVVTEIAASLGLKNITAIHERAEKVKGSYDFVVTRAVAPAKKLWNWSHHLIKHTEDGGIICLKGGDLKKELNELKRPYQIIDISAYFKDEFFSTKKIVYIPR